jgi:hypothetical protein
VAELVDSEAARADEILVEDGAELDGGEKEEAAGQEAEAVEGVTVAIAMLSVSGLSLK